VQWQFLKIPQQDFKQLQPDEFSDLNIFKHEQ
jgi:hypothetical protein